MKPKQIKFLAALLGVAFFPVNVLATPSQNHRGACYHFQAGTLQNAEPCILTTASGAGVWGIVLTWKDGHTTKIIRVLKGSAERPNFRWLVEDQAANMYKRDLSEFPLALQHGNPQAVICHHIEGNKDTFCYQFMND